jgi:hypothetical protein
MGLTATKSLRLEDAGLDDLFEEKKDLWKGLAKRTFDFVKGALTDSGEPVRPDDLITPLVPALEASPVLREYLASKKLTQKFWNEWFAELIVESLWDQLA